MGQVVNVDPHSRIALQGHDSVAFHTVGKAIKGKPDFSVEHGGYIYLFSSEENRAAFEGDPDKYLPAYGGFCAYGVSLGVFFPVEIDTWEVIDGRLVLQYSQDVKKIFGEEKDENIRKADENWPKLEAESGK